MDGVFVLALPRPIARSVGVALIAALRHAPLLRGSANRINIPALTARRASTTLELRPGDTFAMAGLFQHDYQNNTSQTPWLGDVPVLGALFRSARFKRAETELMIIVTPRLATAEDRQITPLESLPGREPSKADLFLRGRAHDKPLPRDLGPPVAANMPFTKK